MKGREEPAAHKQGSEIDWSAIRGRMEEARKAADSGARTGPEERDRTLRARAKALARPLAVGRVGEAPLEVVEFSLAEERYAVESVYVREVHPLTELTPLPCTPAFVRGLVNVRGQILSVVDLKRFFGLPEKGLSDLNRIVILHGEGMEFGILADAVLGTRGIQLDEIQPSLPTLTEIREEYLKGVTGERTVILDGEKLLSDPDLIVREEVEA